MSEEETNNVGKQSIDPNIKKVKVMQVIYIESMIGNGKDSPLRPCYQFFDMNGNLLRCGDWYGEGK